MEDLFTLVVFSSIALGVLLFVGLGWLWRGRPAEDITDKGRYERIAIQMEIEESEIPLMLKAANEYRRKRGKPQISRDDYEGGIELEQLQILTEAQKQLGATTAGNSGRDPRGF
jgi:hypothetical protein